MKKCLYIFLCAIISITAVDAENTSGGWGLDIGSSNYFYADDTTTVLPAIAAGANFHVYAPYTDALSSYIEANVMTEYDFLSSYASVMYGVSADAGYRKDLLTLRMEVASKGELVFAERSFDIEFVPKLQVIVGNMDFSFYTHHSMIAAYLDALSIGYRATVGAAFPVLEIIVLETEVEGYVDAASAAVMPCVRFSAYPHSNAALTGYAGVRKSFALGASPDTSLDNIECRYRGELSIYFLTRSKAVFGLEGYTRWPDGAHSTSAIETVLNPKVTVEMEMTDSLSVALIANAHVYSPPSQENTFLDGNVSILVRFGF